MLTDEKLRLLENIAEVSIFGTDLAELLRVYRLVRDAPVGVFEEVTGGVSYVRWGEESAPELNGQRVRLVPDTTEEE